MSSAPQFIRALAFGAIGSFIVYQCLLRYSSWIHYWIYFLWRVISDHTHITRHIDTHRHAQQQKSTYMCRAPWQSVGTPHCPRLPLHLPSHLPLCCYRFTSRLPHCLESNPRSASPPPPRPCPLESHRRP